MLASTYPILSIFWSIFIFFALFLWIWLIITIFIDIFRSPDLSGFATAAWFVFVLVVPLFGVLGYLIVRGHKMHEHALDAGRQGEEAFRPYVRDAASDASSTDQLAKLTDLEARGVINAEEFAQQKAKLLAQPPAPR